MAFTYTPFSVSEETKKKLQQAENPGEYRDSDLVTQLASERTAKEAQGAPKYENRYGEIANGLLDKYANRSPFQYDVAADALYQQYKDQYINQGRLAMMDTIGQASALTGGYGNSYAASVGNQAYQGYLQKLNDVVPQLYQMAYDRYRDEGNDILTQYNLYADAERQDYARSRDEVSDYYTALDRLDSRINTERNFDYGVWSDAANRNLTAANNAYAREYGEYSDAYERALKEYQQNYAESQAALAARSGGGGGGNPKSGGKTFDALRKELSEMNGSSSKNVMYNYLSLYKDGLSEDEYYFLMDTYGLWAPTPDKNAAKSNASYNSYGNPIVRRPSRGGGYNTNKITIQ